MTLILLNYFLFLFFNIIIKLSKVFEFCDVAEEDSKNRKDNQGGISYISDLLDEITSNI
jgi:hypothetical protein